MSPSILIRQTVYTCVLLLLALTTCAQIKNLTGYTFDFPVIVSTDFHPNGISIADFDGDGKPDIAIPNFYGITGQPGSINISRNSSTTGKPVFSPIIRLTVGRFAYCLATGDIDGDGKPDIVSASTEDQTISIFRNTSTPGAISFAPKTDMGISTAAQYIVIADVDGDGKRDLVIACFDARVLIFRNTGSPGNPSFAAGSNFPTPGITSCVAVGDIDGDGKPDMVTGNNLTSAVSLFRNTSSPGTISFATRVDKTVNTNNDMAFGVALSDMDGDGKSDLLVTNNNTGQNNFPKYLFSIWRNTSTPGNFAFDAGQNFPPAGGLGANAFYLTTGDVNGDNKPEVAVGISGISNYGIYVFQNTSSPGAVSLAPYINLPDFFAFGVAIADLDADGNAEIAAPNFNYDQLYIYHNHIDEPTIIDAAPLTAGPGDVITITGVNLTGVNSVTFDGIPAASFTVVDDTKITATLGAGASGDLVITGPKGSSTRTNFHFAGPPIVSSFSPASAGYNQTITIAGHNFSSTGSVYLGGVHAYYTPPKLTAVASVKWAPTMVTLTPAPAEVGVKPPIKGSGIQVKPGLEPVPY